MLIRNYKSHITILVLSGLIISIFQITACRFKSEIKPPRAAKRSHIEMLNDDRRSDDYYWLRSKDNPEVIKYLEEENLYTDRIMEETKTLQDRLFKEYCRRNYIESFEETQRIGNYIYYKKISAGGQYAIFYRKKKDLNGTEEVILDQNSIAKNYKYCKISSIQVSDDQRYMAYSIDTTGEELYTIFIKDLTRNQLLKYSIPGTTRKFLWANDNRTIYYCKISSENKANKIYKHKIDLNFSTDEYVYSEKDGSFEIDLYKSYSKKYIFIGTGNISTTETYFIDANNPDTKPKLVHPRERNLQYYTYDRGNVFYILTNDGAENYKVVEAPITNPVKENWKVIVPHRKDVKIDELIVFQNHLVLFERIDGIVKLEVIKLSDKSHHYIKFDEAAYSVKFDRNSDYNSNILQFTFSSLITPPVKFAYNMDTREEIEAPDNGCVLNYDRSLYLSKRIFAIAEDGSKIPIVIAYKKGLKENGAKPMLLTGYGAYNVSNEPKFSSEAISLLDRGMIYGIAQIRGGGEINDKWYEDGKLLKKKNTFTDFIACAEYLIKEKYTSKEKLAIWGRSAGGLLIGAVLNMRPDLFKAAVPEVPFLDALNTMLDPSLYGTVQEYDEWGDPNNKIFYDYIKSYSPYDNIKKQYYPDILVIGSFNDQRVSFWESLKWTAKLREMKTDNNLLLLKIYKNTDHHGASGIYDNYRSIAFKNAFILDRLGIYN